jgi:hypothetical protein
MNNSKKGALVIDGMSGEDLVRYLREHQPTIWHELTAEVSVTPVDWQKPPSCGQHPALTTGARAPPRLYNRTEALRILRIGETTLFWLQRTGKLNRIRIGSRVLFDATEIERIATKGASLTGAEKQAASERSRKIGTSCPRPAESTTARGAQERRVSQGRAGKRDAVRGTGT